MEDALGPASWAQTERMDGERAARPSGGSPWKNGARALRRDGLACLFHFSLKGKAT